MSPRRSQTLTRSSATPSADQLVLLVKFGRLIDWAPIPFHWRLVPEADRWIPISLHPGQGRLTIVVIEAVSGIVALLRQVSWSQRFTEAIEVAIRHQIAAPWDPEGYERRRAVILARPGPSLLRLASARTAGRDLWCELPRSVRTER